ncbi:hypothetical protein Tco_1185551 [Tanacetum coccineum]
MGTVQPQQNQRNVYPLVALYHIILGQAVLLRRTQYQFRQPPRLHACRGCELLSEEVAKAVDVGLLGHTYCPRVATFKDLVNQVFKSGTMRVNGRTRYAYFEQIGKKKKTTIVVTTFTVVCRKTKGRVADMRSVQAYTKSNNA